MLAKVFSSTLITAASAGNMAAPIRAATAKRLFLMLVPSLKGFDGNIIAKKVVLVKTFLKFARFPKAFKQQVLFLQKFKIFTKGI